MLLGMEHEKPPARRNPRFRLGTPLAHDDGSAIAPEWNLHCPECDYDLTGLSSRRCPECGRRFDPHQIWVDNRRKKAGLSLRTPAYVPYSFLCLLLVVLLPFLLQKPHALLPLAVLPVYEGLAFYFRWDAQGSRSIVMALVVIVCISLYAST